jgi:hypothetical protein
VFETNTVVTRLCPSLAGTSNSIRGEVVDVAPPASRTVPTGAIVSADQRMVSSCPPAPCHPSTANE